MGQFVVSAFIVLIHDQMNYHIGQSNTTNEMACSFTRMQFNINPREKSNMSTTQALASTADQARGDNLVTLTIDGRGEAGGRSFAVIDPATGSAFAQCPDASLDQLNRAVTAAGRAAKEWAALTFDRRGEYLSMLAAALRDEVESLATLLTREQGKPLGHARAEVLKGADNLDRISQLVVENEILSSSPDRVELLFRPLGVVGIISPWNVPVGLALSRMAPALYAGNTVIVKPSPFTPLTTLRIGEISRAVLPAGVASFLSGGDDLGPWITEHKDIHKISFTGSIATGKQVVASSAGTMKRVTLELGGNDAALVLPDVNVQRAAEKIFWGAFRNSGQICMAIKRAYVHADIYEEMVDALAAIAANIKVGRGLDASVEMGPIQNRMQFARVSDLLQETRALPGVRVIESGDDMPPTGFFMRPVIVANIESTARLVEEEQFGPILPLIKYCSLEQVVQQLNCGKFGLSASIWSSDLDQARSIAARLDVGTVWINTHMVTDIMVPFGGCKQSGIGYENSIIGLKSYMQAHVIHTADI